MNRRSFLGLIGVVATGSTGWAFYDNNGDTTATKDDLGKLASTFVTYTDRYGETQFGMLNGGYNKASWAEDGDLAITFEDEPPMMEWYLLSPDDELRGENPSVLRSGTPPTFGGTTTITLRYPLKTGEYRLTGAKIVRDDESLLGVSSERTGTVSFPVSLELDLLDIGPHPETPQQAQLKLENTGTAPFYAAGVKFSEEVPGVGDRRHEFFAEGKTLLLPNEQATVTTRRPPFAVPNTDDAKEPNSYSVSIWAHEEAWKFEIKGDKIESRGRTEDTTS